MRLNRETKNKIIKYANQYFGNDIKLYLFGSRVFDDKKGGDIDLYLESSKEIAMNQQIKFLNSIYRNVTERKIDLVIKTPSRNNKPIFHTAKQEGILLC
jgi:predicted nucleotidyltransferase